MEELFENSLLDKNFLFRSAQLIPEIGNILARLFSIDSNVRTIFNTRILTLISSTIQLKETPFTWLLSRLDIIVKQRQETPISRVDLLQHMLQVTTKDIIDVSKSLRMYRVKSLIRALFSDSG